MSLLPFKISEDVVSAAHKVEDKQGHSIELIKYGCLSVEEAEIYHRYTLQTVLNEADPLFCYKYELVFRLLCSRYNLPIGTDKKDVFVYPDSTPVGEPMIEALYEFFEWERLRWDTTAKAKEEEARTKAQKTTKSGK
jgi:hypothetical protein